MNFKKALCLLLAFTFLFSFSSCSKHYSYDTLKAVAATNAGDAYHTADSDNFTSYLKSGLYELLVDKTNFSIGLLDSSGKTWYALPDTENSVGAMLSLELTNGASRYELNSQDNAVAFGKATCTELDTGVVFTYTFQDKAENPKFQIPISLEISLLDGQLSATVDMSKAELGSYTILNLSIMPTFGAVVTPATDDFILLPDGCGAVINLATAGEASYSLDTYGADTYLEDESEHPASFGMFGIKNGNSVVAGMVTSSDTISKVKAVTGDVDYAFMFFDEPGNSDVLTVSYKFISGSAATYASIASICREQFTKDGMLSTRVTSSKSLIPVNISLEGSTKTNFENAEDLAGIFKAKGINSLNIRYENAIKGTKYNKNLGGKSELNSLISYTSSQGFGLYLGVALSNDSKTTFGLSNRVEKILNNLKNIDVPGFCITDVGTKLESSSTTTRAAFAKEISTQANALSANRNLMVDGCNLYTLKNANIVSSVPMTTSYETSDSYVAVPFVQMLLHGSIEYFGEYINTAADATESILKSIEYGALPAYRFSFSSNSDIYYEDWTSSVLSTYATFNDVFEGLSTAKMTGHKQIQTGLMRTEYNNETYIYVNYTDSDISYNGLTIKAKSYLRVN